jgi:hypothetical protein
MSVTYNNKHSFNSEGDGWVIFGGSLFWSLSLSVGFEDLVTVEDELQKELQEEVTF